MTPRAVWGSRPCATASRTSRSNSAAFTTSSSRIAVSTSGRSSSATSSATEAMYRARSPSTRWVTTWASSSSVTVLRASWRRWRLRADTCSCASRISSVVAVGGTPRKENRLVTFARPSASSSAPARRWYSSSELRSWRRTSCGSGSTGSSPPSSTSWYRPIRCANSASVSPSRVAAVRRRSTRERGMLPRFRAASLSSISSRRAKRASSASTRAPARRRRSSARAPASSSSSRISVRCASRALASPL